MRQVRQTRQVYCGSVAIGGGASLSIQSMTNADPHDEKALQGQIERLADAGCDIVRLTVPDEEAAAVFGRLCKVSPLPMVADIHFDAHLALLAIEAGADKIRINPGNIGGPEAVRRVVEAAKARHIPIRVGVNAGSLERDLQARVEAAAPGDKKEALARALAESALRNLRIIEALDYRQLVVSVKASDLWVGDMAYRLVAEATDYPLHIGVTEAGTVNRGRIKSAIGIGSLLLAGVGDTLRVSLAGDPVEEVHSAREILRSLDLLPGVINVVACPTCGRTRIDLPALAERVERSLDKLAADMARQIGKARAAALPPLTVAVMGCPVNGPGEARHADLGIAGGDGKGVLFAAGHVVGTVPEVEMEEALLALARKALEERIAAARQQSETEQ